MLVNSLQDEVVEEQLKQVVVEEVLVVEVVVVVLVVGNPCLGRCSSSPAKKHNIAGSLG